MDLEPDACQWDKSSHGMVAQLPPCDWPALALASSPVRMWYAYARMRKMSWSKAQCNYGSILFNNCSSSLTIVIRLCSIRLFVCVFIICLSPQSRDIHQPMSVYNTVVLSKSCHNLSLLRLLKATIFTNSFYSYQDPPHNHGSHKDMATSESLNGQGWLQEGWVSREVGKSLRGRHMNH